VCCGNRILHDGMLFYSMVIGTGRLKVSTVKGGGKENGIWNGWMENECMSLLTWQIRSFFTALACMARTTVYDYLFSLYSDDTFPWFILLLT
jgi:hypothetical protein